MKNRFEVAPKVYAKIEDSTYLYGNTKAFFLIVSESKDEDYFVGEPWSDVSVNLGGLRSNEIALDNDFVSFSSKALISKVLEYLTKDSVPSRYIQSGFVSFPIYELKDEFLQ